MKMNLVAIVSLYNPTKEDRNRINSYLPLLENCILMDDSENCLDLDMDNINESGCDVEYEWNGCNLGLCKSLNRGIEKAITLGADWILFMDSDSSFYNNIITVYKDYIENNDVEKVAILAPQHNYNRHKRKPKKGTRRKNKVMLSGCLYNVAAIKRIGTFDERFFIDGLDYEWCKRASTKGYRIIECSEAVINHNPATERQLRVLGKVILRYGWDTPIRYYYQFRSMFLMHELYRDIVLDMSLWFKPVKAFLLFDNRMAYLKAWKNAKKDARSGYYGKYCQ